MPPAGSKTIREIDEAKEKEDLKTLEAVFFISGRFLSMQELISLSDLNPIIIGDLIERLKDKYNKDESALEIIEKGGLWKMDVRQEYSHIINKLATGSSEFTKAEQETLAIIAYKQPIKQSVIIKIRGNKAYDHIKKFFDLGLIKKKKTGHTYELSLSDDFYDYFSVSESERTNVPKLSKEIDKEIEEAEKEVEEEEKQDKSENEERGDEEEDTIEEEDKKEKFSSKEIDEETTAGNEEEKNKKEEAEYSKGILGQNKDAMKELRKIAETDSQEES
ncbi:MAG TPA: SMC-Scp complex subunit ScpB [Candidatus Nanoarchaeia archaeon]|nr:SMC-Scp complex subunit ScpB [Candidatus Nanoarchaeia archaeon]